jgi:hypothetical protein
VFEINTNEILTNQGQAILPPELRKNALLISQLGSSNFALYLIMRKKSSNL